MRRPPMAAQWPPGATGFNWTRGPDPGQRAVRGESGGGEPFSRHSSLRCKRCRARAEQKQREKRPPGPQEGWRWRRRLNNRSESSTAQPQGRTGQHAAVGATAAAGHPCRPERLGGKRGRIMAMQRPGLRHTAKQRDETWRRKGGDPAQGPPLEALARCRFDSALDQQVSGAVGLDDECVDRGSGRTGKPD
jgi:hypothetical protein